MPDMDKEFVEYVVRALVSHPDDVVVKRSVDDMGVLLELSVNPEDMGKVIGKAGATAKSIRTLLRVLGSRNDARVNLKIIEPEGSEHHAAAADELPLEEVPAAAAPVEDAEAEMLARTKREFADLDDLDL
ncbi:MAG TPA: KH domain-containing protein [Candidatus Saccharimonadia bacterium]|nr:KH domain-containing protein [Candidatus Saccharimonadia bacterium]